MLNVQELLFPLSLAGQQAFTLFFFIDRGRFFSSTSQFQPKFPSMGGGGTQCRGGFGSFSFK
jgi:hypothetical protein